MGIPSKCKPPAPRSRTHWMDMINRPREPPKPVFEESTMRAIVTVAKSFHQYIPPDQHALTLKAALLTLTGLSKHWNQLTLTTGLKMWT
ncbi:hypothetical protein EMCG_06956 [[Emmonsia] crescens]|uniref:Uncharacterized protein n=1 Tax=[Emmonsia] crescens TaxID=73230 RepID=A0A0G2IA07_9EURO|nr:hypothetical protein EMCG_06956 [Emmonsia crescens UAMH 3008]